MASLGQIIFCSMIVLIVVALFLIILILSLTFTTSSSTVTSLDTFPTANLGKDVLLSCYLNRGSDVRLRGVSVTWEKLGAGLVYQYKDGAPALQHQSPEFKGRTQLSAGGLVMGDASLLLNDVRESDEGVYTCAIGSSDGGGKVNINLRTAAFSAPTFTHSKRVLTAVADPWFPAPNVTWFDHDHEALQANTYLILTSQGVYRVVSTVRPVNTGDTYTCRIENDLVVALSTATLAASTVTEDTVFVFSSAWPLLSSSYLITLTSLLLTFHLT